MQSKKAPITYSLQDVATITGWNKRAIWKAAVAGRLKAFRAGKSGNFRCTPEQIIEFFGGTDPEGLRSLIEQHSKQ